MLVTQSNSPGINHSIKMINSKTKGFNPRFLRRYADLNSIMTDAIGQYITDVKDCSFPNENESY